MEEEGSIMLSRRAIRIGLKLVIVPALFFCLSSTAGAATPLKRVRLLFADLSERMGIGFVAKDQRFFEENGLEVDLVQVSSGPVAVAAMAANEAEFYTVSATGSALGAMASGLDLVWVAGLINKLDGYFFVSPKIQKPEDLKGKIIGVQSFGGGIWMFTMMAFDHWGINPERDKIQLRVIGDQSVLAQALATGIIEGAVLGYAYTGVVQRNGGRLLADLGSLKIPYQGTGLSARRSFVARSPDTVERTLRGFVKANLFIQDKANQPAVIRSLRKWLRLSANENTDDLYERMKSLYDRRISPTREGVQNALRVLSKADPKYGKLKVDDLVDDRIARKVEN
jgi:ABC-type nitrate/sulfonate/bicarbonate transport system substrate-binding protein